MTFWHTLGLWISGDLNRRLHDIEEEKKRAVEALHCATKKITQSSELQSAHADQAHRKARDSVHFLRNLRFNLQAVEAQRNVDATIDYIESERNKGKDVPKTN